MADGVPFHLAPNVTMSLADTQYTDTNASGTVLRLANDGAGLSVGIGNVFVVGSVGVIGFYATGVIAEPTGAPKTWRTVWSGGEPVEEESPDFAFAPYFKDNMVIRATCGKTSVQVGNVLIGDVWLCGGESFMRHTERIDFEQLPLSTTIRQCNIDPAVRDPSDSCWTAVTGLWLDAPNAYSGDLSALPYCFAWALRRGIGDSVPIGLVNVARGGVPLAHYLPAAAVGADAPLKTHLDYIVSVSPGERNPIGNLWDVLVAPLSRASFKGCIWYQGATDSACAQENDVNFIDYFRREQMMLAKALRGLFGASLPFYWAQLPSQPAESVSPQAGFRSVREAQLLAVQDISAPCGMAVLHDMCGQDGLHPQNQQETGARFAELALR